ncbi:MAG: hypothetical protein M3164_08150 [Actinomycetota bacterium]|nr:hypothetical protein [Actinomycetota bacterium]
MAKSTRESTPRKRVKARGSLPAPKVAPTREVKPWYRRRGYQVIAVALVLLLVALGVNLWLNQRAQAEARQRDIRAIRQFERKLELLQGSMTNLFGPISEVPASFLAGTLPPDQYRAQAEGWEEQFTQLYTSLRSGPLGSGLDLLEEARALYVQGTAIFVDAAKLYALAARLPDPADRQQAVVNARTLISHGSAVLDTGARQLQKLRIRYDLTTDPADERLSPVHLPELEVAPIPASPAEPAPTSPSPAPGG